MQFEIIMIGAGGYYDPPDMPGVADTTASLMDEGTTSKSSEQIAQALDTMAASVVGVGQRGIADCDRHRLRAHRSVRRSARAGVGHPAEPELSGKRDRLYKVRARAGLEEQRSDPDFLRQERYSKAVYGNHPASSMGVTRESLEKMTPTRW